MLASWIVLIFFMTISKFGGCSGPLGMRAESLWIGVDLMKSYLVPEAVLNRFLSDFESGIVSYSFSETGSGGDVRYWGVDNDHELVAEVINFFQEGAAFPHFRGRTSLRCTMLFRRN